MRLFGKVTKDLNHDDIERLIQNKVMESRVLDYKQTMPKPNDAGKREILADITAMANTDGGLLIFGIQEAQEDGKNAGYPDKIIGVTAPDGTDLNVEQSKQWLDSVIRDGIEPRISGIEFQDIICDTKVVFIINIPRCLQSPYMVKFSGDSKFYARSNTGKYQMDVRQIREAFSLTDHWRNSSEDFRKKRIEMYPENAIGISASESTLLLQVLPLGERELIDIKGKAKQITNLLPAISATGWSSDYNLDGIVKRSADGSGSYIQIFRNGGMEASELLNFAEKDSDGKWQLSLGLITTLCMKYLHYYLKFAGHYQIDPPFAVYINIINMSGSYIKTGIRGKVPFANGRNQVLLPGVYIDDMSVNIDQALRSSFDMIYQSCGLSHCTDFSEDGAFTMDYLED
ncbi:MULTISPECIES: AlbA family DNA-binding domain-containing protein [Paenibacillus]|uniref:AlbA family DNA-binding domain-containing protein n=1 Tax=Paenibacillus TaxID=44249 RepID=UPI00096D5CDA|nr:ATP-binding protein [Paenibacillus odorifer]OMD18505.1 hypothetical protein BJP50_14345 [Paenibacillus odorifer]